MTIRKPHVRAGIDRLPARTTYLLESLESRTFLSGHAAAYIEMMYAKFALTPAPLAWSGTAGNAPTLVVDIRSGVIFGSIHQTTNFSAIGVQQDAIRPMPDQLLRALVQMNPERFRTATQAATNAPPSKDPTPAPAPAPAGEHDSPELLPAAVAPDGQRSTVRAHASVNPSDASELLEMTSQQKHDGQQGASADPRSSDGLAALEDGSWRGTIVLGLPQKDQSESVSADTANVSPIALTNVVVADDAAGELLDEAVVSAKVFNIASLESPFIFLSDSIAAFVDESASLSIPSMLANASFRRPWAVTFAVIAADILLLTYVHQKRTQARPFGTAVELAKF